MYNSLDKRIWFMIVFLPFKERLTMFQILIIPLLILSYLELSRIELPKLTPSILMEIVTSPVVLVDQF